MPINTSANLNSIIGASIARNLNKTNNSVSGVIPAVTVSSKNVTQKLVESQEIARDTRDRTESIENIIKSILETHTMREEDISKIFDDGNKQTREEEISKIFDDVNKRTAKPVDNKEKIEEEPQLNNNSIKEDN